MENDLAVDMLDWGTTEKARISAVVMDEDSTIKAKIKSVPHGLTKRVTKSCQEKCMKLSICLTEKASHPFI